MIFAAITVIALYHFKSVREWEEATTASVKKLQDYGGKHGIGEAPAQVTPVEKQDSQEEKAKEDTPMVVKTPITEDVAPIVTPTSTSTTTRPAIASEALQSSTVNSQSPTSTSISTAQVETTPLVTPAAQKPIVPTELSNLGLFTQEHIQPQDGHGSYEPPPLLPGKPLIHWTSLPEHFPVPTESLIQLPSGTPSPIPKVQFDFPDETTAQKAERENKLAAVKEAFKHSWKGYKDKAWLQDELSPVSGGHRNPFCGWAATLVDTLDTLWIMGLEEDFTEASLAVGEIDFTTSFRNDIPLFETTIRYLGGLVSAYDISGGKYRVLLDKAVQLADVLMGAFDTPNRMPITYYFWKPTFASNPHRASVRAVLAELGSLSMEFTRLAQITKETRYYDAIARITNEFETWQNNTLVPGMWPHQVDASGCKKPDTFAMTPVMHSALNGPHAALMPPANPLHDPRYPLETVSAEEADDVQKAGKVDMVQGLKKSDVAEKSATAPDAKAPMDPAVGASTAAMQEDSTLSTTSSQEVDADGRAWKGRIANWGGEFDTDETGKVPIRHLKPPASEEDAKKGSLKKRQLVTENLDANVVAAKAADPASIAGSGEIGSLPPLKQTKNAAEEYTPASSATSDDDFDCKPQGFAPPPRTMSQTYTFGGQADSVYEYLPKQHLLLGGLAPQYRSMYEAAVDAATKRLLYRPMIPGTRDIRVLSKLTTIESTDEPVRYDHEYEQSHLLCFSGGMYALGSKIFDRKDDLDIAAKLTDGCVWAYEATKTGIMPESFQMIPCKSMTSCMFNETLWYEKLDPYRSFREQGQKNAQQQVLEQKQREGLVGKTSGVGVDATANEAVEPKVADMDASDVEPATNTGTDTEAATPKAANGEPAAKKATDAEGSAPKVADNAGKLPTEGPLAKRQLGDIENDPLLGPKVKSPAKTLVEEANDALAAQEDATILQSLKDKQAMAPIVDKATSQENLYPAHEEYARSRIANEGLPIGVPSINSRNYILRLAFLYPASFISSSLLPLLAIFSLSPLLTPHLPFLAPKPSNPSSSCTASAATRSGAKRAGRCSMPSKTIRASSSVIALSAM